MLAMMFIGATIGLMMISETAAIAQTMLGMSSSAAALIVSTYALFNTGSRIVVGWISDKIGRIRTITYVLVLMVLSLLAIYLSGLNGNTFLFRAGICLIGFSYGSFMGIYPAFTSDQFGVKYSALNYGILFIGFSLAGVVGPLIMQKIFSEFASYRPSFPIAIVFALIGIALTFLYRAANRKLAQNRHKIIPDAENVSGISFYRINGNGSLLQLFVFYAVFYAVVFFRRARSRALSRRSAPRREGRTPSGARAAAAPRKRGRKRGQCS